MSYIFPQPKLIHTKKTKAPLVLVACGSFSPITFMHLRLFEMARDKLQEEFDVIAGYISPVHDSYGKKGLINSKHRLEMCRRAVGTSEWLLVDDWEIKQLEWQRTAVVLKHFQNYLKELNCKIMLLAGADLVYSFITPKLWDYEDVQYILKELGIVVIERKGTDLWEAILEHDDLFNSKNNLHIIPQVIYNDISATRVRLFIKRGMSIKYLTPDPVIDYINMNKLFEIQE